jgi:hypothetical protein
MQHWAPPQYSEDGRWWWNGQRWVPVTWPLPARDPDPWAIDETSYQDWTPAHERRRRTPGILWVGLVALILLVLLAAGAGAGWIAGRAQGGPQGTAPTPLQSAPVEPEPTVAPTSGPVTIGDYRAAVLAEAARFQAAGQAVSDRCAPATLRTADCMAALRTLGDSIQQFQADLDAHPAPACLQPADREMRAALNLYQQGVDHEVDGIQRGDPLTVLQGAGTLAEATGRAQHAGSLFQTAC